MGRDEFECQCANCAQVEEDASGPSVLPMVAGLIAAIVAVLLLGGCARGPVNPNFVVSADEAKATLRAMEHSPVNLARPVVVVGGYLDISGAGPHVAAKVRKWAADDRQVIFVSVSFCRSLEEGRRKIIEAVERQFPSSDPQWTSEVDVIGVSLGGLVGRFAAAPNVQTSQKRLRVARLFTISSPHGGARLAALPAPGKMHSQMRSGSAALVDLARWDAMARYELYPYVCLGDWVVGRENAAPTGHETLWLASMPLEIGLDPHRGSWKDPRILADIGRRLRGEQPLSFVPGRDLPALARQEYRGEAQASLPLHE